jgi:hypothetical protein
LPCFLFAPPLRFCVTCCRTKVLIPFSYAAPPGSRVRLLRDLAARLSKTRSERIPGSTCGLERPPRFPWQRSGVAPDHFGALPASKLRVAPCATSMLPTISSRPWVTLTVTGMVTRVFHAPVTFPREKGPLNLIRILPALDRRRSLKQKM